MNDDDLFKIAQAAPKADMNLRWFLDNYPSLAVKYPDKFLAIDDCTVMDSDSDLNKLLERTQQ